MPVRNTTNSSSPGRTADRRYPAAHNNGLFGADQTDRPVLFG
jgi:hypothetical protein